MQKPFEAYHQTVLHELGAVQTWPSSLAESAGTWSVWEEKKAASPTPPPAPSTASTGRQSLFSSTLFPRQNSKRLACICVSVPHLYRVNILQWWSQSVSDPFVDLYREQLDFVSHRLLSGLKLLAQNLHYWFQRHDLRTKLTRRRGQMVSSVSARFTTLWGERTSQRS